MWHIELVKNKYESLEDLYSLLQYVFRLNKTADDSRRANIITDDLTGCLPAMIPDINNPDMVYRLMLFIIQRRHKDTPQLVRHRIVSFQASDCILPQDLIPLAQSIASSYVAKGFIAAYGIHADTYCVQKILGRKRTLPKRVCQAILILRWNRWIFPMICEKIT